MGQAEASAGAGPKLFVVNTVRRWHTRGFRRRPTTRHRFTQILCGGAIRLIRGKSRPLSLDMLLRFEDELRRKQEQGAIEVRVGGPKGELYTFGQKETTRVPQDQTPQVEGEAGKESGGGKDGGGQAEEAAKSSEQVEPEVVEKAIPEPPKPLDRMNKTELVEYCSSITGMPASDLEVMTKKEILEAIQGVLPS